MHVLTISWRGGNEAKGDKTEERKGHDEHCCQVVTQDQLTKRPCLYTPLGDKENKDVQGVP
jgi:hypothetical protein